MSLIHEQVVTWDGRSCISIIVTLRKLTALDGYTRWWCITSIVPSKVTWCGTRIDFIIVAINTPNDLIQVNPLSLWTDLCFSFQKRKTFALTRFGSSLLAELKLKGKFDFLGFLIENNLFHIVFCCDLVGTMPLVTFGKFQPWGAPTTRQAKLELGCFRKY